MIHMYIFISVDFDGTLSSSRNDLSHQAFLNFVTSLLEEKSSTTIVLLIGSARQSITYDLIGAYRNRNGSCFNFMTKMLAEITTQYPQAKNRVILDKFLLEDLDQETLPGTHFDRAVKDTRPEADKIAELIKPYNLALESVLDEYMRQSWVKWLKHRHDYEKRSLLLQQFQHVVQTYLTLPENQNVQHFFYFIDDVIKIAKSNHQFFSCFPEFVPKELSFEIFHYENGEFCMSPDAKCDCYTLQPIYGQGQFYPELTTCIVASIARPGELLTLFTAIISDNNVELSEHYINYISKVGRINPAWESYVTHAREIGFFTACKKNRPEIAIQLIPLLRERSHFFPGIRYFANTKDWGTVDKIICVLLTQQSQIAMPFILELLNFLITHNRIEILKMMRDSKIIPETCNSLIRCAIELTDNSKPMLTPLLLSELIAILKKLHGDISPQLLTLQRHLDVIGQSNSSKELNDVYLLTLLYLCDESTFVNRSYQAALIHSLFCTCIMQTESMQRMLALSQKKTTDESRFLFCVKQFRAAQFTLFATPLINKLNHESDLLDWCLKKIYSNDFIPRAKIQEYADLVANVFHRLEAVESTPMQRLQSTIAGEIAERERVAYYDPNMQSYYRALRFALLNLSENRLNHESISEVIQKCGCALQQLPIGKRSFPFFNKGSSATAQLHTTFIKNLPNWILEQFNRLIAEEMPFYQIS